MNQQLLNRVNEMTPQDFKEFLNLFNYTLLKQFSPTMNYTGPITKIICPHSKELEQTLQWYTYHIPDTEENVILNLDKYKKIKNFI